MSLFDSVLILYNPNMGKRINCISVLVPGLGDISFAVMFFPEIYLDLHFTPDFKLPLMLDLIAAGIIPLQKQFIVKSAATSITHYHIETPMSLFLRVYDHGKSS